MHVLPQNHACKKKFVQNSNLDGVEQNFVQKRFTSQFFFCLPSQNTVQPCAGRITYIFYPISPHRTPRNKSRITRETLPLYTRLVIIKQAGVLSRCQRSCPALQSAMVPIYHASSEHDAHR